MSLSQPLILIAQIQRSGGTLLSQLFDGHPECLAYPSELLWGRPKKWNWPELSGCLHDPGEAFDYLRGPDTRFLREFVSNGYMKYATTHDRSDGERYPFCFNLSMQRRVFTRGFPEAAGDVRRILDLYMTAYFNAWLDCQTLYRPSRFITAFTPRVNMHADSVEGFFGDYPDGWLVSLVRHPGNWWASAREHGTEVYRDMGIERALDLWARSATSSVSLSRERERAVVYRFEDLVGDTKRVMRDLCDHVGVTWSESLLRPTFNTMPVFSDSSFKSTKGIDQTVLNRRNQELTDEERRVVERYLDDYECVPAVAADRTATA